MWCTVKWASSYSKAFSVPIGTKQGGVISPDLFSVCMIDLIHLLRKSGVGCHLLKQFLACILFADDLTLLSPSRSALQKLIDICRAYCEKFCLSFNTSKSKIMLFGKNVGEFKPLKLNDDNICLVDEIKYLGTTVVSGKSISFTARPDITSFYRAANSVLNVLSDAHEDVLMSLLYTNCMPILTYACAVKQYSSSDMTNCNTAVNSIIRKIFGFAHRQSVRTLREISGYKSIYTIFANSQSKFLQLAQQHKNSVIRFIASQPL